MGSLTSELILKLIDGISGPAGKVAGSLRNLDQSAQALSKAKPIAGWGASFQRELDKLNPAPAKLAKIRAEWERLQQLKPLGAARYLQETSKWADRTLSDLRRVRGGAESVSVGLTRMTKLAGAAFAAAGGGYAITRTGRAATTAVATSQRESARDYLQGMSVYDSARIKGQSLTLSGRYPSVDMSTMHESLRETAGSMRSVDKALQLGDVLAQGMVVLQSLKGKDKAIDESRKFFKALDTLGKNVDPEEISRLYDGYIRAVGVEGADLNMGDLFKASKLAKSAGPGMSDRFLMSIAPGLMQDMGPDRFGTAMGSALSQIVGGRATKQSKAAQKELGLRDKRGNFVDSKLMQSDPDVYVAKHLIPALQKKGVNIDDTTAVAAALSKLFSNQVVADLFTKLVTQREQYAGKSEQYEKAPGIKAAKELPAKDPFVAWEGFMSSLRNFAATVGDPVIDVAAAKLRSLTEALGGITEWLSKNPQAAAATGWGLTAAAGGAAVWTGAKVAGLVRGLAGAGGAAGGGAGEAAAAGAGSALGSWFARFFGPAGILIGSTVPANEGEVPIYTRNEKGEVVPNQNNPLLQGKGPNWRPPEALTPSAPTESPASPAPAQRSDASDIWSRGVTTPNVFSPSPERAAPAKVVLEGWKQSAVEGGQRSGEAFQSAFDGAAGPLKAPAIADEAAAASAAGARSGEAFQSAFDGAAGPLKAPAIDHLDQSQLAGDAGRKVGAAFRESLAGELEKALSDAARVAGQIASTLGSISAHPSVGVHVRATGGGADGISRALGARTRDAINNSFSDVEFV